MLGIMQYLEIILLGEHFNTPELTTHESVNQGN